MQVCYRFSFINIYHNDHSNVLVFQVPVEWMRLVCSSVLGKMSVCPVIMLFVTANQHISHSATVELISGWDEEERHRET